MSSADEASDHNQEVDAVTAVNVASSANPEVRALLGVDVHGNALGDACIEAVRKQLDLFTEQQKDDFESLSAMPADPANPNAKRTQERASLFDHAAQQIAGQLGFDMEEDQKLFEQIRSMPAIQRASQKWDRIPYVSKLQLSSLAVPALEAGMMIDQWIQRNERYMRARLSLDSREPLKSDQGDGAHQSSEWQRFLVALGRSGDIVFGATTKEGLRTIERPTAEALDGLFILDHQRKATVQLRDLASFQETFERMTEGALKGLDWNNVLVAGGMTLAPLTAVSKEEEDRAQSADLDLYLYNLTEEQAIAKLHHIEQIFKANLPEGVGFSVLRNARTITFHPHKYPHRRVQVVLKLCLNPMEILLNFDLDQVAMGYDGNEVWMLPRCARSLVTGYTVFTMDLIHGHYLNDRRATQDQRIFKYADRGYGIRVLFSYIAVLYNPTGAADPADEEATPVKSVESDAPSPEAKSPPSQARTPVGGDSSDDEDIDIHDNLMSDILWAERERVKWFVAYNQKYRSDNPYQHVELSCRGDTTVEQSHRSAMGSWQALCRHVALWELAQKGIIKLDTSQGTWAEEAYCDDPIGYAEAIDVAWDNKFHIGLLKEAVDKINHHEAGLHRENVYIFTHDKDSIAAMCGNDEENFGICRSFLSASLTEALEQQLRVPVNLPNALYEHCQTVFAPGTLEPVIPADLASSVQAEYFERIDNEHKTMLTRNNWYTERTIANVLLDKEYTYCMWIKKGSLFQLVNREQDELVEILHAFRYGHAQMFRELSARDTMTVQQICRRAVDPTTRHEIAAFTRWALTELPRFSGEYQQEDSWDMLNIPIELLRTRFELTEVSEEMEEEYWQELDWWHVKLKEDV